MERAHRLALGERMQIAAREVAALAAAALALPEVDVGPAGLDDPEASPPPAWPGMGPAEHYWTIVDAYAREDAGPSTGTLSNDLVDIYLDVKRGLRMYERGDDEGEREAAWIWRVSFTAHWGRCAAQALAALQQAIARLSPLGPSALGR